MNSDELVRNLLEYTKNNPNTWTIVSRNVTAFYPNAYQAQQNYSLLLIDRYAVKEYDENSVPYKQIKYRLLMCDDAYNELGVIQEEDLRNETILARLYRLAERQANHADDALARFLGKSQ